MRPENLGERSLSRRCRAILKQQPQEGPQRSKKSYAPLFHAASRKVRRDLYDGNLAAVFPAGSFPPALPFVGG